MMDIEDDDMNVHMVLFLVGADIFCTYWNDRADTIKGLRMG